MKLPIALTCLLLLAPCAAAQTVEAELFSMRDPPEQLGKATADLDSMEIEFRPTPGPPG
ncbi:hypothetical protein IV102_30855 [bacterium]|nr:hypothetical protein [bacterium]